MGVFSKLFNAFKSIRLNDNNPETGQTLNCLLIGSMYAEQQSAFLNSYETGLKKSDVKKLVENYWGIHAQNDAVEVLQDLHNRNNDEYIDVVYKAIEDSQNYVSILTAGLPDDKKVFEFYLDLYRKLSNCIPGLFEQKIITGYDQLRRIKDSGWNYGRSVFLSRCCYELGYLSKNELEEYIATSYSEIKNYCKTWQEYTSSYIVGRAIWGGANNDGMIEIANDLLNNDKSPLKNKTYL